MLEGTLPFDMAYPKCLDKNKNGYIFRGGNSKIVLSPSEMGSTLKAKNLLPFSEGDRVAGMQTGSP